MQEFSSWLRKRLKIQTKAGADAQRNRERILGVAKQRFTRVGANASLEEIARADVGPGTLYRHFRTREDLVVAVYRSEMEKLAEAERTLAGSEPPVEALRAWLLLLVDAVETKHIIAPVLIRSSAIQRKCSKRPTPGFTSTLRPLVKRAIKRGAIRKDLDRSISFGLWSASRMSRPALTGSKARRLV